MRRIIVQGYVLLLLFFWQGGFSVFCSKGNMKQQFQHQGPVVRKVDNAIQRITWFVLSTLIRWIAIYPVDSVIQPLSNRGQTFTCILKKI